MSRVVSLLAIALFAVGTSGAVASTAWAEGTVARQATAVDPQITEEAHRTAELIYVEAATLLALDAFDDDTADLERLVHLVGNTELAGNESRPELLAHLLAVDGDAAAAFPSLNALEPKIGVASRKAVSRLLPASHDVIANNGSGPHSAELYVSAIDELLHRNGRGRPPSNARPGVDLLARALGDTMRSERVPTTQGVARTVGPAGVTALDAPAPDEAVASEESKGSLMVRGLLASVLLGLGGLLWHQRERRVRKVAATDAATDLLEISRRLAAARSTHEIEEVAVRQAMRVVRAAAGAFVRYDGRDMTVGFETDPQWLVRERLGDGSLHRVMTSGIDLAKITDDDPAFRSPVVSVVAAPVLAQGSVLGAIVVGRETGDPFGDDELHLVGALKPFVGAAMGSAKRSELAAADALMDGLTGVKNRRALERDLDRLAGESKFAVVMLDLDHFKAVNDQYGHQAGDDVLREVAARLAANVRPGDDVYRYGGEEFAIVLPAALEADAAEVAERVRLSLAEKHFMLPSADAELEVTASFGVSAGSERTAVFGRADAALYESKRAGRNRVTQASAADIVSPTAQPG